MKKGKKTCKKSAEQKDCGKDCPMMPGIEKMPKIYRSLTQESGDAATEKIIAGLKEEFGPDVSVVVSIMSTEEGRPMMSNMQATGFHIKALVLKITEMMLEGGWLA